MIRVVQLCGAALLIAACSAYDEPNLGKPPTTTVAPVVASTTTQAVQLSVGLIRIGPAAYDLDFTCIAQGAGEVLAVGFGTDVNGKRVEAWVQAFLSDPYVDLKVGEGDEEVVFQPRLEGVLEFDLVDDVLRFPVVDFVTDLDLETGEFTPAGVGSVVVECRIYDDELPPYLFD